MSKKFIIISIIVGVGMAGDAMIYCILPVTPESFGISIFQIGILLSVNRFVRLLTNEISTIVVTRFQSDKPLIFGVILSACITLGYAVPLGFWWLLFLRILWGGCFSIIRIEGYIATLRYSDKTNLSRFMAWYETLKAVAYGAMTLVAGTLADVIPVLLVPVCMAALTASCLLFFKGGNADLMGTAGRTMTSAPDGGKIKIRLSNMDVFLKIGFISIIAAAIGTMFTAIKGRAIVDYILPDSGFAIGAATFAALFSIGGQVVQFLGPVIGTVFDRIGRKKAYLMIFGADIFMLAVLAIFQQWYVVLFIFIFQLFVGTSMGIIRMSFAGEYARPGEQAVFLNRISTCLDMGSAAGPFIGYTIYAATGNFMGIACAVIPMILLAMFTLKRIKGTENE